MDPRSQHVGYFECVVDMMYSDNYTLPGMFIVLQLNWVGLPSQTRMTHVYGKNINSQIVDFWDVVPCSLI
jgi:hypothetical protein